MLCFRAWFKHFKAGIYTYAVDTVGVAPFLYSNSYSNRHTLIPSKRQVHPY